MCNLYSLTKSQTAIIEFTRAMKDSTGILTEPEEIEVWLTSPLEEALKLQRPMGDGFLKIVARGTKKDGE